MWTDPHKRFDSWSELNKLGVFPKDRMTMVYTAHTAIQRTSDYDGRERRRDVSFNIYCPEHAPKSDSQSYSRPNSYDSKLGPDEWTRVIVKDGRQVRELDGRETYGEPEQGGIAQEVYEHFGYPAIPAIPDMPRYR